MKGKKMNMGGPVNKAPMGYAKGGRVKMAAGGAAKIRLKQNKPGKIPGRQKNYI